MNFYFYFWVNYPFHTRRRNCVIIPASEIRVWRHLVDDCMTILFEQQQKIK